MSNGWPEGSTWVTCCRRPWIDRRRRSRHAKYQKLGDSPLGQKVSYERGIVGRRGHRAHATLYRVRAGDSSSSTRSGARNGSVGVVPRNH